MYYDYPEEEFYPESEYQEQIDALKEVIKSSVKSEILEEMNRLRAENEKLHLMSRFIWKLQQRSLVMDLPI